MILCVDNFLNSLLLDIILEAGRWSSKSGDWEGADNEHVVNQAPESLLHVTRANL